MLDTAISEGKSGLCRPGGREPVRKPFAGDGRNQEAACPDHTEVLECL